MDLKNNFGKILIDYPVGTRGYCHLVGDSIQNLHLFAESIGVKRCWFHNPRGKNKPHYDVKGDQVTRALNAGAEQVTSEEIVTFLKEHYSK